MNRLTRGDMVRVRLAGSGDEWCDAEVVVASNTAVALQLFGAVHDRHNGVIARALPLFIDYAAGTAEALWGDQYEIEPRPIIVADLTRED